MKRCNFQGCVVGGFFKSNSGVFLKKRGELGQLFGKRDVVPFEGHQSQVECIPRRLFQQPSEFSFSGVNSGQQLQYQDGRRWLFMTPINILTCFFKAFVSAFRLWKCQKNSGFGVSRLWGYIFNDNLK